MAVMALMSFLMSSISDLYREGEVGEVAGTIASDYLYFLKMERVLLEGFIMRNIYWLVLLCDL